MNEIYRYNNVKGQKLKKKYSFEKYLCTIVFIYFQ